MKRKLLVVPMLMIALTSCDTSFFRSVLFNDNPSVSLPSTTPYVDSAPLEVGDGYYKTSQVKYTLRDVNEKIGWHTLKSTGNQKMLIVPVQLKDGTTWTSEMLTNIETAFFGQSSETSWRSVKSFFAESSYGKLSLSGEVTDVLMVNDYTVSSLNRKGEEASDIVGKLFEKSSLVSSSKRKEYDQDNDGYIDCTVFIYSNAYSTSSESAYWAWCYYYDSNPSTSKPALNNYMWASYTFLNDKYSSSVLGPKGLEAHTYIHETGHLLGLDDYYCYDDSKPWDCAGDRDMQAYNIGDHNIYSKLAMGWINPYVITDSCEISLRSSALYDEAILIKNNWNGSIFDDYLLLEFYTPEGNNYQDSQYSFASRNKMYNYSGLRIYHVDSRLVMYTMEEDYEGNVSLTSSTYISDFVDNANCFVGASNSIEYQYLMSSQNPKNYIRYLHLIDKGGNNTLSAGTRGYGDSTKIEGATTLWVAGDTFSATKSYFANGDNKFNDGTEVGYKVKVENILNGQINLKITKI